MAEAFDPYHKWLGIPPKDQPPNHYRLLGIERFESDPQVIELAADRQMTHVRTFQTGPNSALSQRLLNELAAARLCLLNAQRKADYDRTLQTATAQSTTPQQNTALQQKPPVQPQQRQQTLPQQPAFSPPNLGAAEQASFGTIPLAPVVPAQTPLSSRPQMSPAPFGGGHPPAIPAVRRPRKSNDMLVAAAAAGALLLVSVVVIAALVMKLRPRADDHAPGREEVRQVNPKPSPANTPKPVTPAPAKPTTKPGPTPPPVVAVAVPSVKFANARRFMAQRDLDAAERELAAAQPVCYAPNDRQECTRLEQLLPLLRAFWNAVQEGWNSLQPGEELPIGNETYSVVKVEPTSLVLRSAGKETTFTLASLTGDLAETLASRHLDANSPSIYLCLGAFHALDRNGDRQQASVMWNLAANAGLNLAPLMPELTRR